MNINDGTGGGYAAKVTSGNKLRTYSVIEGEQAHINEDDGQCYSVMISGSSGAITPGTSGAYFLYLKNNSDNDLIVSSIKLRAGGAEAVNVVVGVTGTPAATTTNTPINRNAASNNVADCDCYTGTSITGLTNGNVVDTFYLAATTETAKFSWKSRLVIPKNQTIAFYPTNGSITLIGSLSIHFHTSV